MTDFVNKTKLTELENEIPDVSCLATKTELTTTVENKKLDVRSLVNKNVWQVWHKNQRAWKKLTDHNHDKYITTPKFNTIATSVFNARLAQVNLITKTHFDATLLSLNRKITANKLSLWVDKTKKIWFKLFYWQKSCWRRLHTKLFSISANVKIF